MRPHPRIRKTAKWGGAAVTMLLVVVWIGSGWWRIGYVDASEGAVYVASGQFFVEYYDAIGSHPFYWEFQRCVNDTTRSYAFNLKLGVFLDAQGYAIPLWPLAVASLLVTAIAWRLDTLARRRERMGLCPKCHYDRTGLVGGAGAVCPECGSLPA